MFGFTMGKEKKETNRADDAYGVVSQYRGSYIRARELRDRVWRKSERPLWMIAKSLFGSKAYIRSFIFKNCWQHYILQPSIRQSSI